MASSCAMHGSMAGMSDSDPIMMPTTGVASLMLASFPILTRTPDRLAHSVMLFAPCVVARLRLIALRFSSQLL